MFVARKTEKETKAIMKALTAVQALDASEDAKRELISSFIEAIWEAERSGYIMCHREWLIEKMEKVK